MIELSLQQLETVIGGQSGNKDVPRELIRLYCQRVKSQGMGMEEAVLSVIRYYGIPLSQYDEIRAYVISIWNNI